MNTVALLDIVAASASLVALLFVLALLLSRGIRAELVLLSLIIFLTFAHDLGNYVEWAGLSNWFDPIEDYMEVLTAAVWAFFFYTYTQELTETKLRDSFRCRK